MTLLIKPIITEKSMRYAADSVFTFEVERGANKHQIKELVEKLFKVNVTSVTSSVVHTADKRTGRKRLKSTAPSRKYARVALKAGQKIALFDLKEEK